jgi:NAD(P)H-dependent FMN reductase
MSVQLFLLQFSWKIRPNQSPILSLHESLKPDLSYHKSFISKPENMKISIISSSTRKGRVSHRIALMLQNQLTERGVNAEIIDLMHFDMGRFEETFASKDQPTTQEKEVYQKLEAADGFIFVTPEYNGSISSGLKHFIDFYAKKPFEKKPIGVATGSTGMMGGTRAAHQLQLSILACFAFPIPHMLLSGQMDKTMSEDGTILDEAYKGKVDFFLNAYVEFAEKLTQ